MHFTEYWAIVEHNHVLQNPTSPEKMALLAEYCGIRNGLRILDIGCGKGYLLRSWASRWAINGTGLEINPWFISSAHEQAISEGVANRLTFLEGAALDFDPDPASYDVVLCIGASFALGGLEAALGWMRQAMHPEGVLAIGEPFLNGASLPKAVRSAWSEANTFSDLATVAAHFPRHGLELHGLIAASPDDWDRYESPKWHAAYAWAAANPDHPDRAELLERVAQSREAYLRWERHYLGWGIFVARLSTSKG